MPKGKHPPKIFFDEPAEDRVQTEGERIFDLVDEDGTGAIGLKDVLVSPKGEGPFLLHVSEKAIVLVLGMYSDPGLVEGPEEEAELDTGAGLQAAMTRNDADLLPGREKQAKDIVAFMEGEQPVNGDGESRLLREL
jgi:hypothetical protein